MRPAVQFLDIRRLQRELVLGAADPVFHGHILHRLQIQGNPGQLGQFGFQPGDHFGGADRAFGVRFQVDQEAAAVGRGIDAVDADKRRQAVDRRILKNQLAPAFADVRPLPRRTRFAALRKYPG